MGANCHLINTDTLALYVLVLVAQVSITPGAAAENLNGRTLRLIQFEMSSAALAQGGQSVA